MWDAIFRALTEIFKLVNRLLEPKPAETNADKSAKDSRDQFDKEYDEAVKRLKP